MTISTERVLTPNGFGNELGRLKERDDVEARIQQLLVGSSQPMRELRALTIRASRSRLPVLIQGPTGAGKELVAKALHHGSGRTGDLIALNVCALAETVFEDALFGHVKGAFTGAIRDTPGYLAEANGGTLFLDEINGLPLIAQAKLLRAIETGVFRPVGAQRDRMSDFRLIAATNDDLAMSVVSGSFRRDLLFRLSGLTITVPSLIDRIDDIPELVEHFLGSYSQTSLRLRPDAVARLRLHSWPGNVRELKHVTERLTVICESAVVTAHDVQVAVAGTDRVASDTLGRRFERQKLLNLLVKNSWNTARVAEETGVNRTTVYRRMLRLGITPSRFQWTSPISNPADCALDGGADGPEVCA